MLDTDVTPTPTPAPDAAPVISAPPPTADLSAVATPPPQPNLETAVQNTVAPFLQKEQAANQRAAEIANQSTAAKPVPHARLLAMVSGLATGLSAFGTSIATHGKEGGVQEVEQVQAQEQQQKIQAQEAREAQKNTQIQQQLMVADTNHKMAQNIILMATLPDEVAASHLKVTEAQQGVTKNTIDIQNARKDSIAQWGVDPLAASTPAGAAQNIVGATKVTQQLINFASDPRVLGPDNPAVKDAQTAFAAAQKTGDVDAMTAAMGGLKRAIGYQTQATEMGTKQQAAVETAPIGDSEAANQNARSAQRYDELHKGAALPDEYKVTGAMSPAQVKRVTDNLKDLETSTGLTESRALTNAMHQENLDMIRGPQGIDPSATGQDYIDAVAKTDPGQADMIQAYGQGRLVLSPQVARTPQGQALAKQILRAYPNYIAANAEGYQKQYSEFTSGKTGTAINSYSTAVNHLNQAFDHVTQASNVDLNNPTNDIHRELATDKPFLASELAKAVSNGQMTEGEQNQMLDVLSGKTFGVATKDRYATALREIVNLMKGKLDSYQSQWASTAVPGSRPPSNLTDAVAATQKLAGTTGGGHVIEINGVQYQYNGSGDTADLKNYTKK